MFSGVRRTNLGLTDARRTLPAQKHSANCKVWWRRNNGLGLFGLGPLVPVILCFQLWQLFGEGPFLFQHDNAPVHKARSIQKWFVEVSVEELDWPAQSLDLNPIGHLWDELECQLRARLNRPTSVPNLINARG